MNSFRNVVAFPRMSAYGASVWSWRPALTTPGAMLVTPRLSGVIGGNGLRRVVEQVLAGTAAWMLVALLFAVFGYVASLRLGSSQPWWPSLGYAAAIFSIWALLTAPLAMIVGRIEGQVRSPLRRLALYAAGLPIAWVAHVFAFAAIYWPFYSDAGRISSRWMMGEHMLLANLDTDDLLYAALVGGFIVARRHRSDADARSNDDLDSRGDDALVIRARGRFVRVPLDAIDHIEAAGDYSEVRAGEASHLIDESLASLAVRLPVGRFARIYRRTIVALGGVVEVRGVGRGDGVVRLADGTELRLSRRYRREFDARLPG